MIRSRPLAIVGSVLARLGAIDAVAVWPSASHLTVALDLNDRSSSTWMRPLLPPRARALGLDPGAWQAARARALVRPRGQSLLVTAAERVLGRPLDGARVSLYSPSACAGKLTAFVAERGRSTPTVVVKAMARRRNGWWLCGEAEMLMAVRSLLSGEVSDALPAPPLFAGELDGEYLLVEAYACFEEWAGGSASARARVHDWLELFQRSTTCALEEWGAQDTDSAIATVCDAWHLLRPATAGDTSAAAAAMLRRLQGTPLPRCAQHGDFTHGNLALCDGQLKILDWEWSTLHGAPYFDLWSYQLAELHRGATAQGVRGSDEQWDAALDYVERRLGRLGVERRFALATLPAVLSELTVRVRRTLGAVGRWELVSEPLMAGAERLMQRHAERRATTAARAAASS